MRRLLICAGVAAIAAAVSVGGGNAAKKSAGYAAVVEADGPSAYWRLGELDATTAVDSSGHGFDLSYDSSADLGLDAEIQDDPDTSAYADGSPIATGHLVGAPAPGALEAWVRMDPIEHTVRLFHFAGATEEQVTIDPSGIVHAQNSAADGTPAQHLTGPDVSVIDGSAHYVVVDFQAGLIYVDLTAGPPASTGAGEGGGAFNAPLLRAHAFDPLDPSLVELGGSFVGQLDEVALYPTSLTLAQMTAHATAGGLGWDRVVVGGEEGSRPPCVERGLFWKGVSRAHDSTANFTASGAASVMTNRVIPTRCASAAIAPTENNRPSVFAIGRTIRVKLGGDLPQSYAEFGPVQYACDVAGVKQWCFGVWFNVKIANVNVRVDFNSWLGNRVEAIRDCPPLGAHAYRMVHVGNDWHADFACDPNADPSTDDGWVTYGSEPDHGLATGFPDTEWFTQSTGGVVKVGGTVYNCGPSVELPRAPCAKREGAMAGPESDFRWFDGASWNDVPFAVCRIDRNARWDGEQVTKKPPITVGVHVNVRDAGC